jgi:hypothetical protein
MKGTAYFLNEVLLRRHSDIEASYIIQLMHLVLPTIDN